MNKNPLLVLQNNNGAFSQISHVGIVVKDINDYAARLSALFGFNVDQTGQTPDDPNKRYRGQYEDFSVRMAYYYIGSQMIELLMPTKGRSVWQDFLDTRGEGLHHINFNVEDFDAAVAHLSKNGLPVVQSGTSYRVPGARWCYIDAIEQLGYYLELFEMNPQRKD